MTESNTLESFKPVILPACIIIFEEDGKRKAVFFQNFDDFVRDYTERKTKILYAGRMKYDVTLCNKKLLLEDISVTSVWKKAYELLKGEIKKE